MGQPKSVTIFERAKQFKDDQFYENICKTSVFSVDTAVEMSSEIGQSVSEVPEQLPEVEASQVPSSAIPAITVTAASEDIDRTAEEAPSFTEPSPGVSSEGEKTQPVKAEDEGREAVASERPSVSSVVRGNAKARRSGRVAFRSSRGTRGPTNRTPIVWDQPGSTQQQPTPQQQQQQRTMIPQEMQMQMQPRPGMYSPVRGGIRGRRPGRGRPLKGFPHPYMPNPRY